MNYFGTLIATFVCLMFLAPFSWAADYSGYDDEAELYAIVKALPANQRSENAAGYARLMELNPSNEMYKAKYAHYSAPPSAKANGYHFENDADLAVTVGLDRLAAKKLNAAKGSPVTIDEVYLWSMDSNSWENGGRLEVYNDYSMGTAMKITCSLSAKDGDAYMENPVRMDVKMTGTIAHYSTRDGLVIQPCKIQKL